MTDIAVTEEQPSGELTVRLIAADLESCLFSSSSLVGFPSSSPLSHASSSSSTTSPASLPSSLSSWTLSPLRFRGLPFGRRLESLPLLPLLPCDVCDVRDVVRDNRGRCVSERDDLDKGR